MPQCTGGVILKMGEPFVDAVAELDGMLEISVKTDYPMKIIEKSETAVISIIVAPRVDGNE